MRSLFRRGFLRLYGLNKTQKSTHLQHVVSLIFGFIVRHISIKKTHLKIIRNVIFPKPMRNRPYWLYNAQVWMLEHNDFHNLWFFWLGIGDEEWLRKRAKIYDTVSYLCNDQIWLECWGIKLPKIGDSIGHTWADFAGGLNPAIRGKSLPKWRRCRGSGNGRRTQWTVLASQPFEACQIRPWPFRYQYLWFCTLHRLFDIWF